MTEELVSHKLAVLAKEIGFNEECFYSYATDDKGDIELHSSFDLTGEFAFTEEDIQAAEENGYLAWFAPTQSHLQKWLRKVHDIYVLPMLLGGTFDYNIYKSKHYCAVCTGKFESYEESLNTGLLEACKLLADD